jgi:hypothetical protein
VSGRYDFAVRIEARRLRASMRPSHPAPNVRDDREAPLLEERGTAETSGGDLPDGASDFSGGSDMPMRPIGTTGKSGHVIENHSQER